MGIDLEKESEPKEVDVLAFLVTQMADMATTMKRMTHAFAIMKTKLSKLEDFADEVLAKEKGMKAPHGGNGSS